jgi:SEC-C motif-containing protein
VKSSACPCGSGQPLAACCGPRLDGQAPAPDAAALMRSRYTAYVLGDAAYLLQTWHPTTRPVALHLDEEPRPHWIGLTVKRHEVRDADHALVEFVARYKINGRAFKLHETSRFMRMESRWFYVDGDVAE